MSSFKHATTNYLRLLRCTINLLQGHGCVMSLQFTDIAPFGDDARSSRLSGEPVGEKDTQETKSHGWWLPGTVVLKGKVGKAERIHLDRTKKWMIHLLPIHNEWRIMNDLMICDDWGWQRDSFTTFTQLAAWDRGTDRPAKFCRVEGFRA